MKKIILSLGILGIMVSVCSCEKEKMNTKDVTKDAFLAERTWKLNKKSFSEDADATPVVFIDSLVLLQNCEQDNFLDFKTQTSGSINEYHQKCAAEDPQERAFFFTISKNDTYISFYTNKDSVEATTYLQGVITTPDINHFNITVNRFDDASQKNQRVIYEYEAFKPDF